MIISKNYLHVNLNSQNEICWLIKSIKLKYAWLQEFTETKACLLKKKKSSVKYVNTKLSVNAKIEYLPNDLISILKDQTIEWERSTIHLCSFYKVKTFNVEVIVFETLITTKIFLIKPLK
jgi:hypothetical protein